jgi:peroxiredoxin
MISVDNIEENTKFAKMHEADYPILSDDQGIAPGRRARATDASELPSPDGKIPTRQCGETRIRGQTWWPSWAS